jgi:acyl-CoA thioester hydrolase
MPEPPDTPVAPFRVQDCPINVTIPVWWGDQDALGHVNNTVYLRWFETSRIAYCERVGLWNLMVMERIGPILAAVHCNFRHQLHYPETVRVGTRMARIGHTSLRLEHVVETADNATHVADGYCVLVVYDYNTQKPRSVPATMRQAIEALEGKTFPPATDPSA